MKNQANDTNYIHQHSKRATTQLDVSIILEGRYREEQDVKKTLGMGQSETDGEKNS